MALTLSLVERRLVGVLVEKGFTTPQQYPLTLNALVAGANQQSCRDPVMHVDEEAVVISLESLREKGLVTLVRTVGGRTDRYKHRVTDTLGVEGREAAVLAELLLRGPQSDGELRQRANRMVPIPDLGTLAATIEALASRDDPLMRRLSPPARRRGARYAHTLYAEGEAPPEESEDDPGERTASPSGGRRRSSERVDELERRVAALEARIDRLEAALAVECPGEGIPESRAAEDSPALDEP